MRGAGPCPIATASKCWGCSGYSTPAVPPGTLPYLSEVCELKLRHWIAEIDHPVEDRGVGFTVSDGNDSHLVRESA